MVRRAIVFDNNNPVLKSTKSFAGERNIDIPASILQFLVGYIKDNDNLYLFSKINENGLITKSSYTKMWESIIKK